jgi:hypothetical protein
LGEDRGRLSLWEVMQVVRRCPPAERPAAGECWKEGTPKGVSTGVKGPKKPEFLPRKVRMWCSMQEKMG